MQSVRLSSIEERAIWNTSPTVFCACISLKFHWSVLGVRKYWYLLLKKVCKISNHIFVGPWCLNWNKVNILLVCAHIPEVVPYWHITYPATKNSSPNRSCCNYCGKYKTITFFYLCNDCGKLIFNSHAAMVRSCKYFAIKQ